MKRFLFILTAMTVQMACGSQKPLTEAQYAQSVRKTLPFTVSEFRQVRGNTYAFKCDKYVAMSPDYEVDAEGVLMIWRTTFTPTHTMQSPEYIWRNIVVDKRNSRLLCIDRLLKDGKTFGYVYVLQAETKNYPDGYHWDVTDHRHMLNVAPIVEEQTKLSLELLKTLQ